MIINKKSYLILSVCFAFVLMGSLFSANLVSAVDGGGSSEASAAVSGEDDAQLIGSGFDEKCDVIAKKMDALYIKNDKLYSDLYDKYENNPESPEFEKEMKALDKKLGMDKLSIELEKCFGVEPGTDGEDAGKVARSSGRIELINDEKTIPASSDGKIQNTVVKDDKSEDKSMISTVALVGVVIVIGGLLWFFFKKRKEKEFRL